MIRENANQRDIEKEKKIKKWLVFAVFKTPSFPLSISTRMMVFDRLIFKQTPSITITTNTQLNSITTAIWKINGKKDISFAIKYGILFS